MALRLKRRSTRHPNDGFTLVEVMIAVAIVAILASIAGMALHRYRATARMSEATNVVAMIKVEQEHYRNERGAYVSVSNSAASFYPATSPGKFVTAWGGACSNCVDGARGWESLPVKPADPVMYGYSTVAGVGGAAVLGKQETFMNTEQTNTLTELSNKIQPADPFDLITALGDLDGNGTPCTVLAMSGTNGIVIANEGE